MIIIAFCNYHHRYCLWVDFHIDNSTVLISINNKKGSTTYRLV
nr:MAG TPA: hypothetical protein [Caudoviricetes sp.]